jgi:CubicO group peptidase (beta-lactamase class C family)
MITERHRRKDRRINSMSELIDSAQAGWSPQGIQQVMDFAADNGTAQIVIRHETGLLAAADFSDQAVDVFAVQKGLVAILVGMAQEKGFLEVWDHINHHLHPEWTQLSPWDEAKLSIETLLTMTTGMDDELRLHGEINKDWRYNNVAYGYLKHLLEQATGMSMTEITEAWLLQPLGMNQTRWQAREQLLPDGTAITALHSTASDLASLGLMILQRGQFEGASVFGEAFYLDEMLKPGSAANPAWGWLWWNNNQAHYRLPATAKRPDQVYEGVPVATAPADLFVARGLGENFLAIVPGLSLVVARTAVPAGRSEPLAFEREFWRLLMAARLADGVA